MQRYIYSNETDYVCGFVRLECIYLGQADGFPLFVGRLLQLDEDDVVATVGAVVAAGVGPVGTDEVLDLVGGDFPSRVYQKNKKRKEW